jgi:hypothetical protein
VPPAHTASHTYTHTPRALAPRGGDRQRDGAFAAWRRTARWDLCFHGTSQVGALDASNNASVAPPAKGVAAFCLDSDSKAGRGQPLSLVSCVNLVRLEAPRPAGRSTGLPAEWPGCRTADSSPPSGPLEFESRCSGSTLGSNNWTTARCPAQGQGSARGLGWRGRARLPESEAAHDRAAGPRLAANYHCIRAKARSPVGCAQELP